MSVFEFETRGNLRRERMRRDEGEEDDFGEHQAKNLFFEF